MMRSSPRMVSKNAALQHFVISEIPVGEGKADGRTTTCHQAVEKSRSVDSKSDHFISCDTEGL
jgi:hypothetical protein